MYKIGIVGAGAAGLFLAAAIDVRNVSGGGILMEGAAAPGRKLLVTGGGQCNLTRSDDIREFIDHYGDYGSKIRSCLYKFNNEKVIRFFESRGVPCKTREDGKVFPASFKAEDVRSALVKAAQKNGWRLQTGTLVESLKPQGIAQFAHRQTNTDDQGGWIINGDISCQQVVLATGGCSWGKLGLGKDIFPALEALEVAVTTPKPALVPLCVERYPFGVLAGGFVEDAQVRLCLPNGKKVAEKKGPLLFTHKSFSGPVILNISRYAEAGMILEIQFSSKDIGDYRGVSQSLWHHVTRKTGLSRRLVELLVTRAGALPEEKTASVKGRVWESLRRILTESRYVVSGSEGFAKAMVTAGGLSLSQISTKTFQVKNHPGLFACGEVLDVDGDTGGYNLQFAFSSAAAVARSLEL